MEKPKLFSYLSLFEENEFINFRKFINSPYFNKNKNVIRLFEALRKVYPNIDYSKLSKRKIFAKIFSSQRTYSENYLNMVMSELTKLIEQFWQVEQLKADSVQKEKYSIQKLMEIGLIGKAKNKLDTLINHLSINKDFHPDNLFYLFSFYKELFSNPSLDSKKQQKKTLNEYIKCLEEYIIQEYFLLKNIIIGRERVSNESYDLSFKDITQNVYQRKSNLSFQTNFYAQLVDLQLNDDTKLLHKILADFQDFFYKIHKRERFNISILILNILFKKIRTESSQLNEVALAFYKFCLREEIIPNNNQFTYMTFINIISTACKAGMYDWAKEFVEHNAEKVDTNDRENAKNYALGVIIFSEAMASKEMEKLENAEDFLIKLPLNDPLSSYGIKSLIFRLYYDLYIPKMKDLDRISDFIAANQRALLREKRIKKDKVRLYKNFFSAAEILFKFQITPHKNRKIELEKVSRKIARFQYIHRKDWIKKKLEEL